MENQNMPNKAQWSRGMILALGARGPGFKSRLSPSLFWLGNLQRKTQIMLTFYCEPVRGLLVQWYDSRFGCERSRVQLPDKPTPVFFPEKKKKNIYITKELSLTILAGPPCTRLFTDAIPLLLDTEVFGCSVSRLAQYTSPQTTWMSLATQSHPYRCQVQHGHPIAINRSRVELPTSSHPQFQPPSSRFTSLSHQARLLLNLFWPMFFLLQVMQISW